MKYLISTLSLLLHFSLIAQPGPSQDPLEALCNPICDWNALNDLTFTLEFPQGGFIPEIPGCYGGVFNNPMWFSFVSNGGDLNILINPYNCQDVGNGSTPTLDIQAVLYEINGCGCPSPNPLQESDYWAIVCGIDCGIVPQERNIFFNAKRGVQYFVMVDGCNGDICDLAFNFSGVGANPLRLDEVIEINDLANGDTVQTCPGIDYLFTVNGDDDYQSFIWTSDNEEEIIKENRFIQNFQEEGDYLYCVEGATACDTTQNEFCITVQVRNDTFPSFEPFTPFCFRDSLQILPSLSSDSIMGSWSGPNVMDGNIFDPSNGSQELLFIPDLGQCADKIVVSIPVDSCAFLDTCLLNEVIIIESICNDMNTPDDPSDDVYSVDIIVNGTNTSNSWTANDPLNTSGSYGVNTSLGPYSVLDTLNIIVTDSLDANCNAQFIIQAPSDCGIVSTSDLISNGIEVYPNPFTNEIFISSVDGLNYESELINNLGQVIKQSNNNQLETANINPGVYYLRIKSNGRVLGTSVFVKLE